MEEERAAKLTISNLIQYGHPFTVESSTSSLVLPNPNPNPNPISNVISSSSDQIGKPETLKPLKFSSQLIGKITLPSLNHSTPSGCICFQFSDRSATTICCYVLDFDPKMIGEDIQILSWNFIPTKCVKRGFLEIIKWNFLHSITNSCSFSRLCSFCCVDDTKHDSSTTGNSIVFGVIELVSPVSTVPCSFSREKSDNAVKISGFLVRILVCECKLCSSKYLVSEMKNMNEENVGYHLFTKTKIVYFCGLTSSWYPVISRLIGNVVFVSMLKKKLVVLGKEKSQLMYVAMDYMSLHVLNFSKKHVGICNVEIKGKGEYGMYTGVVSGVYMQGMVVELDQDVMVLLTDQYLIVPHCLRIGAIVTLKNVHIVHPKFEWGSMLILGACYRTSMSVESFSPLESGCYLRSYSFSPLQNFIDSLSFSPRLWVLLVTQCFKKKFSGFLLEQEILGSKHVFSESRAGSKVC